MKNIINKNYFVFGTMLLIFLINSCNLFSQDIIEKNILKFLDEKIIYDFGYFDNKFIFITDDGLYKVEKEKLFSFDLKNNEYIEANHFIKNNNLDYFQKVILFNDNSYWLLPISGSILSYDNLIVYKFINNHCKSINLINIFNKLEIEKSENIVWSIITGGINKEGKLYLLIEERVWINNQFGLNKYKYYLFVSNKNDEFEIQNIPTQLNTSENDILDFFIYKNFLCFLTVNKRTNEKQLEIYNNDSLNFLFVFPRQNDNDFLKVEEYHQIQNENYLDSIYKPDDKLYFLIASSKIEKSDSLVNYSVYIIDTLLTPKIYRIPFELRSDNDFKFIAFRDNVVISSIDGILKYNLISGYTDTISNTLKNKIKINDFFYKNLYFNNSKLLGGVVDSKSQSILSRGIKIFNLK